MFQGKVHGIFTAPARREPMASQQEVRVVPGKGIEGDRYFKGNATYSDRPGPHRELTLIELENLDALEREYGYRLQPEQSRRNLLVSGVPLNHLIDREFTIGDVRLRGLLLCEPCANLAETSGHSHIVNHLMHRGGLRAEILNEGTIRIGAEILPGGEE
jgi:MOSC domain-containing protein YiiM